MSLLIARLKLPVLLGFASMAFVGVAFAFLFKAGCAGDLKTGSLGDPIRALQFESVAFLFFMFGLVFGAGACAARLGVALHNRMAHAIGFIIFGGLFLWLVGIQFEVWGVQHCFSAIAL